LGFLVMQGKPDIYGPPWKRPGRDHFLKEHAGWAWGPLKNSCIRNLGKSQQESKGIVPCKMVVKNSARLELLGE